MCTIRKTKFIFFSSQSDTNPSKATQGETLFNLSSNTDARMHDIYAESLLALAPNAIKSRGGNASCSLILSSNLDSSSLSSCVF